MPVSGVATNAVDLPKGQEEWRLVRVIRRIMWFFSVGIGGPPRRSAKVALLSLLLRVGPP